jgi:ABC-type polysaccharide/polyol phosphate transport system ATPase subunit
VIIEGVEFVTVSVRFENVSKIYRLGSKSLRGAVSSSLKRIVSSKDRREHQAPTVAALRDVSLEIERGEAVGVIGPNGVGKSTTLKLIAGITETTSGRVSVDGRVSALLELGAGFHPDLTGRENIYLNAAIIGMSQQEIEERFDSVVAFSELERFLDTPVKRYSSGMYCRLGFSVAAHADPDILLIDEVLAVGDAAFQTKCLNRMRELKEAGTTILFVSHTLPRVRRLCERAILLHDGRIVVDGPSSDVIATYASTPEYASNLAASDDGSTATESTLDDDGDVGLQDKPVTITQVTLLDRGGEETKTCPTGDRLTVRIGYQARGAIERPTFEIWFHGMDGMTYAIHSTRWDGYAIEAIEGEGHMDVTFDPMWLLPGAYDIDVAISDHDSVSKYAWRRRVNRVQVRSGKVADGLVYLPHEWELNSGS